MSAVVQNVVMCVCVLTVVVGACPMGALVCNATVVVVVVVDVVVAVVLV